MCAVRTKLAGRGAGKGARRSRHRMITQRDATLPGVRGGQASTGRARGENPLPWPDPCPTLCPVPGGGAEASSWPVGLPSSWTAPAGSAAAHAHGSSASGPACTGPQPGPRGFWPDRRPTEEGLADSRGAPALAGAPPSLHRAIRADCRPLPPARPQGLTGPRPAPRGGGRSLGAGVCASGAWRARQLPPQPLLPERRPPPPPYRGAAPAGPRPAPAIGSAAPGAASPPGAAATPLRALSSALAVPRLCLPLAPAPRLSRASRCRPPRQPGPPTSSPWPRAFARGQGAAAETEAGWTSATHPLGGAKFRLRQAWSPCSPEASGHDLAVFGPFTASSFPIRFLTPTRNNMVPAT